MAGSVNKVILIGNLGRDPEIRFAQNGNKIANFSIATSDTWRDKTTGERKEKTEWHRIVVFSEGLATITEKFLKKGSKVYIEGALQTRKWTGNDGIEKYTTEVVLQGFNSTLTMLDGASGAAGGGASGAAGGGASGAAGNEYSEENGGTGEPGWGNSDQGSQGGDSLIGNDLDDEIPF